MERSVPQSRKHTFERRNAFGVPYEMTMSTSISELVLSTASMINEPVAYVSLPKKVRSDEAGMLNPIFVLNEGELEVELEKPSPPSIQRAVRILSSELFSGVFFTGSVFLFPFLFCDKSVQDSLRQFRGYVHV